MRVEVVDEQRLLPANALFSALDCLTVVIGPFLGGLLLLLDERAWGFAINALSYVVAVLLISRVRTRSRGSADSEEEPFFTQLSAGLVTILREPVVRTLVLFVALDSAVFGATTVLYVPMAEHLRTSDRGFSYLVAAFAFGGLLISIVVNRLAARERLAPVVLGGMLLLALPFAATLLTHSLWVGLALQVVAGAGMILVDIIGMTALQRGADRGVLSRALGALDTLALGGILAGNLLMVPLLEWGGIDVALLTTAGIVTAATFFGIRSVLAADRRGAEERGILAPRVALLEALDMFTGAPQAVLERLAGAVEEVLAEPGTVLMRQGEHADALWVVVSGAVEVTALQPDGSSRVVSALGAHSYHGEIGLLQRIPRTATVTTTAASKLWRIPAEEFFAAMSETALSASFRAVSQSRLVQIARVPSPRTEPPAPTSMRDVEREWSGL
jgi:CRP-like cAMP-binding protein